MGLGDGVGCDGACEQWSCTFPGVSWRIHTRENVKNLDCLGLHFARFHGEAREYRVVERRKGFIW